MTGTPAQAGGAPAPAAASAAQARLHRGGDTRSFIRTFPCSGCGARLTFAPGTHSLACEFCGAGNRFEPDDARIEELDLETYLKALQDADGPYAPETAKCERCGAEQALPRNHFAAPCSHCRGPIVGKGYAGRKVKPKSLVPFQVGRERAQEAFRKWVAGLRVAPTELERFAQSDAALTGTYLPFWTYDCHTASRYDGERGIDRVREGYGTLSEEGGPSQARRRAPETVWEAASGYVERFHDDVLVPASRSLHPSLRGATRAWNLKKLVPYKPEYVSGYAAEAYEVGLAEGYPLAKEVIDANIQTAIRAEIGGDRQKVSRVSTEYDEIRFKHVLLPVWVSAYRYRDKTYRFLVNGQTGEIAGESPVVFNNVAWLVAGVIAFFVLVALFSF